MGIDSQTKQVLVKVSPEHFRPTEVDYLLGDATKAKEQLGWIPKTSFKSLVKEMVASDLKRSLKEHDDFFTTL